MTENSNLMRSVVVVNTIGLMGNSTMACGTRIRCMGRVCLPGKMGNNMKESSLMTKETAWAYSFGLTVASIWASGNKENSMAKELI